MLDAQSSQLLNNARQHRDDSFDIFSGVLFAQGEAQAAVRPLRGQAHGYEDMGWIDRAGGASGTG